MKVICDVQLATREMDLVSITNILYLIVLYSHMVKSYFCGLIFSSTVS